LVLEVGSASGQSVSAEARFNVIRPTIDFAGSINGSVALDTNYIVAPGILCLHFGGSINNGTTNFGINCTASNPNLGGYDTNSNAGFFVVQVITSSVTTITKTDGSTLTINTNGLDNYYPAKNLGTGNGTVFSDAPGIGGFPTNYIQISRSENFKTVLMFLADEPEVIPVPMKEIDWNWSGSISFTNNEWFLTSSNAAITANNQDTLSFPTWSSAIHNAL
jgi:hypothetical protein